MFSFLPFIPIHNMGKISLLWFFIIAVMNRQLGSEVFPNFKTSHIQISRMILRDFLRAVQAFPREFWKGKGERWRFSVVSRQMEEPVREGVLLHLTLTNKEGHVGDGKVGGSHGCSDHKITEFSVL